MKKEFWNYEEELAAIRRKAGKETAELLAEAGVNQMTWDADDDSLTLVACDKMGEEIEVQMTGARVSKNGGASAWAVNPCTGEEMCLPFWELTVEECCWAYAELRSRMVQKEKSNLKN